MKGVCLHACMRVCKDLEFANENRLEAYFLSRRGVNEQRSKKLFKIDGDAPTARFMF